uniref:Non-compact myelin associated protein n=1 Tax=Zonotrichia albicollis TaxID=44394 RepID=A0A8D2NEJ8_ZONAL
MTTATPLTNNTQLSVNVTTKSQEHNLYQSKARTGVVALFGFKWTLNLSNFKHYSDNFANMAFFPSCSLPGSGAIVAAIVVGVIVIFTVVLLILKTYNRRMRVRRELEPKGSKLAVPPPVGHSSHSLAQQPSVTFIPVDIHLQSR